MTDAELERAAEAWIADYFQARHLLHTRDWVVELEPGAGAPLRVAALTHDIERRVPGGPDPWQHDWGDPRYVLAHSARSARIVTTWLEEQGASAELVAEVERLILHHEIGGYPDADLLQAADSLSFLEVNAGRAREWVAEGRCALPQAQAKLDLMLDRVAVAKALPIAARLHAAATAGLHAEPAPVPPARIHSASLREHGAAQGHQRR